MSIRELRQLEDSAGYLDQTSSRKLAEREPAETLATQKKRWAKIRSDAREFDSILVSVNAKCIAT